MGNEIDYIDGEKFEGLADVSFGDAYTNEKNIDLRKAIDDADVDIPLVYCSIDSIDEGFEKIRGCGKMVDLISHNGDTNLTHIDVANKPQNVRFWFSQNMMHLDEHTCPLPIGMERKFWSKKIYGIAGYKNDCISKSQDVHCDKDQLLYVNFHIRTNRAKRQRSFDIFKNTRYSVIDLGDKTRDYDNYIGNIKRSKFVLSPEGHGMDCHRTWETLYAGSIPVIERNLYYENLYSDLPVLLVDDFSVIDEKLLHSEYERINNTKWNMDKMGFHYWEDMILGRK